MNRSRTTRIILSESFTNDMVKLLQKIRIRLFLNNEWTQILTRIVHERPNLNESFTKCTIESFKTRKTCNVIFTLKKESKHIERQSFANDLKNNSKWIIHTMGKTTLKFRITQKNIIKHWPLNHEVTRECANRSWTIRQLINPTK